MTVRALAGLFVFNLFVLGVGAGVLWGMRGWRWWTDFARLLGVAYVLGLSALTVLLTYALVLGIPVGAVTILVAGCVLAALGVVVGHRRGFSPPGIRPPGWRTPGISLFAALFVAGIVVYLEGLFRADRLAGVAREWDSWASWLPKAKGLYAESSLEPDFLLSVAQTPSYPPGPATMQAGAFHAMGSADTATLHVQYWFLAVGFVLAVSGLLWRRVHAAILFPLLLAFLVLPSFVEWVTTVYSDIPLGYLVAVAALLIVLWVEERQPWQLAASTLLLAGAMLTKREGLLFAACVFFAGFVASFADRRQLWGRLFRAGLIALALVLPWRIWFTLHDLPGDGPDAGYFAGFSYFERVWPAFELSVTSLFDDELWRFAPFLAVSAIVLALLAQRWQVALYAGAFLVAAIVGAAWVFWSNLGLGLNQDEWAVDRLTGTTVLVLAVLTPLLLQRAWSADPPSRGHANVLGPDVLFRPSRAAWVVVLLGALSHPGSMLAGYSGSGLPGGSPTFPGTAGCAAAPVAGARARLVVGYADSYPDALALRERARVAGLPAETGQDGCGRLRVYVDDLPTIDAARALLPEAQAAGLSASVERDPDD